MNKNEFKKFLVGCLVSYNQEPTETKIGIISQVVFEAVGEKNDWSRIFKNIMAREKFCPVAADIIQEARNCRGILPEKERLELEADRFVDRMIAGFTGPEQDWAGLGRDGYYLAKDVLGVTRAKFRSGKLNLDYNRKIWRNRLIRHWEGSDDKPLNLNPAKSKTGELTQFDSKLLTEQVNNKGE